MFREIRTSERITERDKEEARKNRRLMEILDKRISDETTKELNNFWEEEFKRVAEEATFDPDKRIVMG